MINILTTEKEKQLQIVQKNNYNTTKKSNIIFKYNVMCVFFIIMDFSLYLYRLVLKKRTIFIQYFNLSAMNICLGVKIFISRTCYMFPVIYS